MTHRIKSINLWLGALFVAAILGLATLKILYLGGRQIPVGKFGSHEIVFSWTWNSWGSLIANDGRAGYYRIYNSEGQKVFELFSDSYAFDIVLTGKREVEFQLDTVESVFWPPREELQSEQDASGNRR
jgi:hypothetical protein